MPYDLLNRKTSNIRVFALTDDQGVKGKIILTSSARSMAYDVFLHVYGTRMVHYRSSGIGYDRLSHAIHFLTEALTKNQDTARQIPEIISVLKNYREGADLALYLEENLNLDLHQLL